MLRFDGGVECEQMRRTISTLEGVVSYTDSQSVTAAIEQYLGLVWAFIAVMIVLGAVLAFTVTYGGTMAVNPAERTNELATLRALEVPLRRVAGVLAPENITATLLGIPIGLALGVLAAQPFLDSFSNDLFRLEQHLSWWVLPAAALGVLLATAISLLPAVRSIREMDIARVVRERVL